MSSLVSLSSLDPQPPYNRTLKNPTAGYPVDDNAAKFPGNAGEAEDVLSVQCNQTPINVSAISTGFKKARKAYYFLRCCRLSASHGQHLVCSGCHSDCMPDTCFWLCAVYLCCSHVQPLCSFLNGHDHGMCCCLGLGISESLQKLLARDHSWCTSTSSP